MFNYGVHLLGFSMATTAERRELVKMNCGSGSELNMTKLRGVAMVAAGATN